jgi:transaldolase
LPVVRNLRLKGVQKTYTCCILQNGIAASLNYDKCLQLNGDARLSCQLDKALANVGALLANEVEGRVCTEVDPRLAKDKGALMWMPACQCFSFFCFEM